MQLGISMAKRLLLTGGTGFFGRALLRHFHAQAERMPEGHPTDFDEIIVLSRSPQTFASHYPRLATAPWLHWVRGDICRPDSMTALNDWQTVDAVLHAATDSTDKQALTPLQRLDQILGGTRHTLDLAVRLRARRFLMTSSGGVYGPQPANMEFIPEDYLGMPDPLDHKNVYSVAKRAAEHLCALYGHQYGLEPVVARCFAFTGPDLPLGAHFAIGNFIRDALYRDDITVAGDGSAIRSYLDQRDLAEWLLTMLDKGEPGRAYNVGSDQAISIADLAHQVRGLIAPDKPVRILGQVEASGARSRYVPDIYRARTELGLCVTTPLSEAILATAGGAKKC